MPRSTRLLRLPALVMLLVLPLTLFGWAHARADLIGTSEVLGTLGAERERARLVSLLQRKEAREQLVSMGVSPQEAVERVRALSDAEVHRIAGRLDEMPAGGVDIVGVVILVAAVLFITDLAGWTNVYSFIR